MRNDETSSGSVILRTIEIRFTAEGKLYACSHFGWTLNEVDNIVQAVIFTRGNTRIKVAVYDHVIDHLDTFGVWLCRALLGDDGYTWKHVDLTQCDR